MAVRKVGDPVMGVHPVGRSRLMIEGYCVKCKAKRPIGDAVEEQMKNGRKAVKGKCPTCGAVMFKILGGKAVPVPAPGASPDSASGAPPSPSPAPSVVESPAPQA